MVRMNFLLDLMQSRILTIWLIFELESWQVTWLGFLLVHLLQSLDWILELEASRQVILQMQHK